MNEIINTLSSEVPVILNTLHFIRADWFYAFIPLLLYLLLAYKTTLDDKNWAAVIDPALLPFVLTRSSGKQRRYPLLLIFIASSLCITALAGPVYKKSPQPVYREQSSLVILLDLSQSMNAADIKPSRLSRARLELLDLLKTRKTGQTALIVYAADAFVVTPLTDDNATIANLVPSLETDMMPTQGSDLSAALSKTFSLFTQAGIINGDILVITDDIHSRDEDAIKKIASQGHSLSIFGIGTTGGGPIPLNDEHGGGFLQNSNGAIVIAKLAHAKLQRYALNGSGLYTSLQADDSDIEKLTHLFQSSEVSQDSDLDDLNADVWQEEGHWLLLPLLFFAAFWTRKGWLASLLPFALVVTLTIPQTAEADSANTSTINSEHLWSSPDQKAMKDFNAGNHKKAANKFTNPAWKASALYRQGEYQAATDILKDTKSSDGFYNKGNALAKLGQYEDAIAAYDEALALDEKNADAIYNREQVKNALQEQKQENKKDGSDKEQNEKKSQQQQDKEQENKQSEQQSSDKDSKQQENKEQKNSDKKDSEQQNKQSKEKNSEQNEENKQQKQAEDEKLKQRDAETEAKKQKQEQQQYEQDQRDNEQEKQNEEAQKNKEIENKDPEDKDSEKPPAEIEVNPMEASISEEERATEQWLKRIPDDPGGLLRRKFLYQYKQIPNQSDDNEPW